MAAFNKGAHLQDEIYIASYRRQYHHLRRAHYAGAMSSIAPLLFHDAIDVGDIVIPYRACTL